MMIQIHSFGKAGSKAQADGFSLGYAEACEEPWLGHRWLQPNEPSERIC